MSSVMMASEVFMIWLKGRRPSYELYVQFHDEMRTKYMNDEITLAGTTAYNLRKHQAREKGLLKLDNLMEQYLKRMMREGKSPIVFWNIYVTPEQQRKKLPRGVSYV